MLSSLGCTLEGEMVKTPAHAARLWTEHLLSGEGVDLAKTLGRGSRSRARAPVTLLDIGVHLVCPHHLTVAFGHAHLAYLPNGRLAGFGALARLVKSATARLVLQEEAAETIAATMVEHLGARAAVVVIDATHPCHNVPYGRSHRARAVTWGRAGSANGCRDLVRALRAATNRGSS